MESDPMGRLTLQKINNSRKSKDRSLDKNNEFFN